MSSRRQRFLLLLSGCVLIGLGTYGMIFSDTRVASSIGAMLAGMGMVINLVQLLFRLPLELPRRNTAQESELILPSSYPRKKSQHQGELILPLSYYRALQRRQKAKRDQVLQVLRVASILGLLVPIVGLAYLQYTVHPIKGSCVILTKQVYYPQHSGEKYALNITAQLKDQDRHYYSPLDASYGGPYDTLQEAQKELSHFLVGLSYPCHLETPVILYTASPTYLTLDSDVSLSFSPSEKVIFSEHIGQNILH